MQRSFHKYLKRRFTYVNTNARYDITHYYILIIRNISDFDKVKYMHCFYLSQVYSECNNRKWNVPSIYVIYLNYKYKFAFVNYIIYFCNQ